MCYDIAKLSNFCGQLHILSEYLSTQKYNPTSQISRKKAELILFKTIRQDYLVVEPPVGEIG
jgi:hypothetical protein